MKTYTSVIALYARATLGKLLAILALTGLVEAGLFYLQMTPSMSLEAVFAQTHIPLVCAAGFALYIAVLTMPAFLKAGYTLSRMRLTLKGRFLCHVVYNVLCFLIFWGFQVTLLVGLFHWFGTQAEEAVFGPQSILLTFYRVDFLHSLLPLADWLLYLRNAVLMVGVGAMTALPLSRQGSRGSYIWLAILGLGAMWLFPAPLTTFGGSWALIVIALLVFGATLILQNTVDEVEQTNVDTPETPAAPIFQEEGNKDEN